jgi:hypothetical protein
MRGSGNNARMERSLEKAIGALVASYTGETDKEQALKDNLTLVKEIAQVTCEIACAAAVAATCSRLGHHKRYEARYFISGKGVNGNLVRSWEVPELPEDTEEEKSSPPTPLLIFFFWAMQSC